MDTATRLHHLCKVEIGSTADRVSDEDYRRWRDEKRAFRRDELQDGWILKIGDQCGGYLANLKADGTITECRLFEPEKTWGGSWLVSEDGVLQVNVPSGNEQTGPILCTLDVLASPHGDLHGGAETTTEGTGNIEIFRVVHFGSQVHIPRFGAATAP